MIIRRFTKSILSLIVLSISLCCYLSALIPPKLFWPAAILGYAIPLIICLNIILFFTHLLFSRRILWPYLAGILLAFPFIQSTYKMKSINKAQDGFSVMSYNAKLFRQKDRYDKFSVKSIDWLVQDTSDIKCIQEFSYNNEYRPLDVVSKVKKHKYNYHIFQIDVIHNPGMAILSTYPILNKGVLENDSTTVNNIIYADILIKKDTVRIYNVHLKSMRLELHEYSAASKITKNYKKLLSKLRFGAIERSEQIDKLLKHIDYYCPYPVIVCGDFNETPYSYNYFKMKSRFRNSFDEAGEGWGLSFINPPIQLRIDHHFIDQNFEIIDFKVDRSIKNSDHFPTRALYRLNN